jgi:hypothetical protein
MLSIRFFDEISNYIQHIKIPFLVLSQEVIERGALLEHILKTDEKQVGNNNTLHISLPQFSYKSEPEFVNYLNSQFAFSQPADSFTNKKLLKNTTLPKIFWEVFEDLNEHNLLTDIPHPHQQKKQIKIIESLVAQMYYFELTNYLLLLYFYLKLERMTAEVQFTN